jgi:hypothetical protein
MGEKGMIEYPLAFSVLNFSNSFHQTRTKLMTYYAGLRHLDH